MVLSQLQDQNRILVRYQDLTMEEKHSRKKHMQAFQAHPLNAVPHASKHVSPHLLLYLFITFPLKVCAGPFLG